MKKNERECTHIHIYLYIYIHTWWQDISSWSKSNFKCSFKLFFLLIYINILPYVSHNGRMPFINNNVFLCHWSHWINIHIEKKLVTSITNKKLKRSAIVSALIHCLAKKKRKLLLMVSLFTFDLLIFVQVVHIVGDTSGILVVH